MHIVWRFFANEYGKWRWQKLGADRAVVSQSLRAFDSYDSCVAAARKSGYVFQTAQQRTTRRELTRPSPVVLTGQLPGRRVVAVGLGVGYRAIGRGSER